MMPVLEAKEQAMKQGSGDGGSGKGRRGKTPTPRAAPKARPRTSAPKGTEAKIAKRAGGQGALDELQVDFRTSEERWRSLLENPIFGVTFVGQHHRYEGTNRTFQTMVGYTAEELRAISPLDISVPGERELNALYFKELQRGERHHYEMIKQLRRKDGSLIWTHLYVFAVTDRKSGAKLPFGIVFDITDKKHAQDALDEARAELVRVARLNEMGAMTGSIAHEIAQPLSAIVTAANAALRWLARSNPEIEETRTLLQGIVHDGQRASDIIKGVRSMFRADPEHRTVVNVNELIREVLALSQSELRNSVIEVHTELDENLPTLSADPVQLQQVVFNLITNAIDAMDSLVGRDRILRIKSEHCGSQRLAISIEDSGVGIAPENMDRVFKSLFTTKTNGMGMGLAICQSIVESHGGRLTASPAHPHGTVLKITLPIGGADGV
jgi:PAS domain S-box-containing protein